MVEEKNKPKINNIELNLYIDNHKIKKVFNEKDIKDGKINCIIEQIEKNDDNSNKKFKNVLCNGKIAIFIFLFALIILLINIIPNSTYINETEAIMLSIMCILSLMILIPLTYF